MKLYTSLFSTVIFACLFGHEAIAQNKKLEKAEKEYEEFAYIEASEMLLTLAENGLKSEELFQKLGNTYYFNANYKEAVTWYSQLFDLAEDAEPIYSLRYAQSLKSTGANAEAAIWYNKYLVSADLEAPGDLQSQELQELIDANSERYTIENLKINSPGIDFGGAHLNGDLVFASTRDTGVVRRTLSAWDGLSFLNLYKSSAEDLANGKADKIKGKVNTRWHESSPVFTRDGKTMYFTGNDGRNKKKGQEVKLLKIYRAHLIDGKWGNIEDLSINSDEYSNAHPALNAEENILYFSSDRPGSYGQTDIYMANLLPDGTLVEPVNIDLGINTPGRESFPFLTERNELYFSSDGHFGLGGLDVFYVDLEDTVSQRPINVGSPVNSSEDDFAYSLVPGAKIGYYSSNRPGGKGYDDIYGFVETSDINKVFNSLITGKVTDSETSQPLPNSSISLLNEENEIIASVNADQDGRYQIAVERFSPLLVRAENAEYYTDEKAGDPKKQSQEINFQLEQDLFKVYKGEDLTRALGIETIYFDLDKSNIRKDAAVELEKVFAALTKYPQIKIEIRSHTDSRASKSYNERLSERRARATAEYLIGKGIAKERLTYKGYEEAQLVNQCADGTPCAEEEHQQNRRSEFILTNF